MIEATVIITRPIDEVFPFYRDFRNHPRFLGDVMAIETIDPVTSRCTIQGPLHIRVRWRTRLTEEIKNSKLCYETISSPAIRTRWEIYFAPAVNAGSTVVREVMIAPFGRFGPAMLTLIGKSPAGEVAANLNRFRQLLETGKVTDTSYSVKGKFDKT